MGLGRRLQQKLIGLCALACALTAAPAAGAAAEALPLGEGVWISVFSERKILYSRAAAEEFIAFCKKNGLSRIYLQVYQSGRAYYDTKLGDRSKYEAMRERAGGDPIDLFLKRAAENGIRVYAWMNILSLGQNRQADILKRYGNGVLTRDRTGDISLRDDTAAQPSAAFVREEFLFLEPADPRVSAYLVSVVGELLKRYPLLSGVHLDYIRYPCPVPFVPGARFEKFGLLYGFGQESVERFRTKTGLNPYALKNDAECLRWDNWRRAQVTALVQKIAAHVKTHLPRARVSCAVIAYPERAYSSAFQDWPSWLANATVDEVVIMAYTRDHRLAEQTARAALALRGAGRVQVGLGAFLFRSDPAQLQQQYRRIRALRPDGIVFFAADHIDEKLLGLLRQER